MLEQSLSRPLVPICILYWSTLLIADMIPPSFLFSILTLICLILYFSTVINFSLKYLILILSILITIFIIRSKQHTKNKHSQILEDKIILKEHIFKIQEIEFREFSTYVIASFNFLSKDYISAITIKNKYKLNTLIPGSIAKINITLYKNTIKENYEDFNYTKYLDRKHIQFNGFIHEDSICHVISGTSIPSYAYQCNKYLQSSILTSINNYNISNLLIAILLGDKSKVSEKIKNQFISTGTAHILAVSGMHLGILYGIIKYFIHLFGHKIRRKPITLAIITMTIIWVFAFVTGLGSSVVRAAVMFSLLELGINLRRKTDSVNILFGTGFIMSYFNPCIIYDIGFQLSFAAVLSIILFYPLMNRIYKSSNKIVNYLLEITWISIAVQILITPISIYYFHTFPTYFLLANILWIPISTILMMFGITIFILQPCMKTLSYFVGYLTEILTKWGLTIFDFIEKLPYYNLNNLYFNKFQLACLLLCMFCIYWWLKFGHNKFLFAGILSSIVFTFIPILNYYSEGSNRQLICYSNNNYPAFEIKMGNNIFSFQDDSIKKKSYFIRHYPFTYKHHIIFNYKNPQFFKIPTNFQNEQFYLAFDSLPSQNTNLLILKNKRFTLEQLKKTPIHKIIIHPKAHHSTKYYYQSIKDSLNIETYENNDYKINL